MNAFRKHGSSCRVGRSFHRAAAARLLAASAAAVVAASHGARGAVYVFDPGGQAPPTTASDGSGNWDPSTTDFYNVSSGLIGAYGNTSGDTAVFGSGGTAGTVTVGAVTVGTIDFNQVSGNYLLTGGSINLSGAATIFTDAGVTPTIASAITGTALNKTGLGTLTLTGADTFSGFSTIASGAIVFGGGVTDTFGNQIAIGGPASVAGASATSPNVVAMTIAGNTTVTATSNVGLGNQDGAANQSLVLNVNGKLNTNQLFSGYQSSASTTAIINISSGATVATAGGGSSLSQTPGMTTVVNNSGTYTNAFTVYTGSNSNTSNAVTTINNSGTLTVTNGYNMRLGGITTINNSGTLSVANNIYCYGPTTLNVSGGTMTANYLQLGYVGGAIGGTLNISGGTLTLTGGGDLNSDSSATFNPNGGTAGPGTVNVFISGNGTFNDAGFPYLTTTTGQTTTVLQTGGTFNSTGTGTNGVFFNNGLATYNLSGGTLSAANVGVAGSPTAGSVFIFNGGILQARQNTVFGTNVPGGSTGFFTVPSAIVGANPGSTIDSQAFNISIGQSIATGVSGKADAGLTKIGTGSLTFTGTNTYTGSTNIAAGTLTLGGSGSVNGSSVINVNGTGAKLLQLSSVASTPAVRLTNGSIDGTGTLGAVTVGNGTGGVVADGNGSSGTLSTGSLSFLGAANANLFVSSANLAANNVAPVNVLGTLSSTAAGKVTLNFTSVVTPGSTYDLFQYNAFTGDVTGTVPTDFNLGSGISGRVAGSSTLALTSTTGPGFLELVVGSADNNIRWSGAANNTWTTSQASPTNFVYANASSGTQTPFFNGDNVTFDDTGKNTNPINISAGNVTPASMTFNNSSTTYNISSTGGYGITGAGGLVKNGTGVLVMATSNSYTGGNTINAGTLDLGTATALGSGGPLTLGNGSGGAITLDNTSGGPVALTNTSLAINSDLTFVGSSNLSTGGVAGTLSGNRTITVSGNTLTIPEALSGSASLTKAGAGTLTLSAVNPFNNGGGVTVNAGTLNLGAGGSAGTVSGPLTINNGAVVNTTAGNALGYTAGTSVTTVTVNTGSTFNSLAGGQNGYLTNFVLNGGNVTALTAAGAASGGQLQFVVGTSITSLASSTTSNISGGMYLRGQGGQNNFPVNVAAGSVPSPSAGVLGTDLSISGVIGGDANATLVKGGSGVLTLANFNTYPGGTNVSAGTVNLNAGNTGAGTVIGPLTIASGATVNANITDALGYNTGTSVTTLTVNNGGAFVINLPQGGNGNEGFLTNVVLAGGTISSSSFSNGTPTGMFNFNQGGATPIGITTVAGSPLSTISTGVVIRGTGLMPVAANANLTITGPITGSGGVNKTGTGTLTLIDTYADGTGNGNNTYAGGTNIAGGAIRFNTTVSYPGATPTSFLGTGTTVIQSGATLGGTGFTGGPVVVAGTITAGQDAATIGTLTSTAQSWNSSGSYLVKLAGSSNDDLIMSGLTINASSASPFAVQPSFTGTLSNGSTYVIATDTNSAGTPNPFNSAIGSILVLSPSTPTPATGLVFALATQSDGGGYDLLLEVTAAPEPTSLLLLGLAGAPLALGRRRRTGRSPGGSRPVSCT